MAKRFVTIFFIVLGISMFLVTGYFLVLLLAPGFEAFGLKYIHKGARKYDSGKVLILDEMTDLGYTSFSGSIILNVEETPVYVEFTEGYGYYVRYHEDYSGFTRTDIDFPSINFERDNLGNAVISVQGFEKWLWKNDNTERYIKLYIPLVAVSGSNANTTDLKIVSESSDITFSNGFEHEDLRVPTFDEVEFETNGEIIYNTLVRARTLKHTTNNSIIVDKDFKKSLNATNYILNSKNGRINIEVPVVGDVTTTTKIYDIKLISCRNLNVTTEDGDIKCFDKDSKIQVSGTVNINSKTGSVELGKVLGTAQNNITTTSGNVTIEKINNGNVTTKRGSVRITSVNDLKIDTNMGKVYVEESLSKVNISTKRGNVVLGGNNMTVNNPTVFTRLGKVTIDSASQKVNVETIYSDVKFTNKDSADVTIISGGELAATGLTGKVNLKSNGDTNVEFTKITHESVLEVGADAKTVVIKAVENAKGDTRYILQGKMVTRFEDNDNGTGTFSKVESSTNITNKLNGTEPLLKVTASSADVSLYMKAEFTED